MDSVSSNRALSPMVAALFRKMTSSPKVAEWWWTFSFVLFIVLSLAAPGSLLAAALWALSVVNVMYATEHRKKIEGIADEGECDG